MKQNSYKFLAEGLLFICSVLLICSLFWNCKSDYKHTITKSVSTATNEQFPATNQELLINLKGDTIAGYALLASGERPKTTVVLIAGYPGNDNSFDIAQEIRRSGHNAILFHHRGAWGSQGYYSYSNCLEDVRLLIDHFSQPEVAEQIHIDPQQFVLLGRSYGGGIALIAGSQIDAVKKIIAISSVNYGDLMSGYSDLASLSNFKRYMKKQIMIQTNIDDFLQELLDQQDAFNIVSYNDLMEKKKVLIIEDTDKNEDWIQKLDHKEYIRMESDHHFIEQRKALTDLIINWVSQEDK